MYITIEPYQCDRYANLLARMYAKRSGAACERRGAGSRGERDLYDDMLPVYLVDTDAGATDVVSSVRLLPTTGPTLTQQLGVRDGGKAVSLQSPTIWEASRLSIGGADTPRNFQRQIGRLFLACHRLGLRGGIEALTLLLDDAQLDGCVNAGARLDLIGAVEGADALHLTLVDITTPAMGSVRARLAEVAAGRPGREPAVVRQLFPAASGRVLAPWRSRIGLAG